MKTHDDSFDSAREEAKFMADDDDTCVAEDLGICPSCNGSGEGQYDGSTCSACRGKGEI